MLIDLIKNRYALRSFDSAKIPSFDDIRDILSAGADKISINSQAVLNPKIIRDCVNYFGSQCIVVAIDAKKIDNDYYVFINAGKKNTGLKLFDWAKEVENFGIVEINNAGATKIVKNKKVLLCHNFGQL